MAESRNDEKESAEDYEVGYRKPPKHSRWQKGQSGNPKGREEGLKNLRTDVKTVLSMEVNASAQGVKKTVSTQQAALLRLREQALGGSPKALDRLLSLASQFNNDPEAISKALVPEDIELVKIMQRRLRDGAWEDLEQG